MSRTEKITGIGCFLLILIHLIASYFPKERLWGLNLLYFLPPLWKWILVIAAILILMPQVNKAVGGFWNSFHSFKKSKVKSRWRYLRYILFSLAGGVVFWIFRVKTYLLGDSFLRARAINLGGVFSNFTEPLDFYLHMKISLLLGWDAFRTYAFLSVLAGVIFLFLCQLFADIFGKDNKERWFIILIILTLGSNQLFFGYVESYTLVYVAIFLFIFLSFRYLENKSAILLPVLAFFLALSLHLLSLVLLPSLLYLIYQKRVKRPVTANVKQGRGWIILTIAVILVVAGGTILLQHFNPDRKGLGYYLIFPLGGNQSYYSIFSASHLLDLVNHQLLITPIGIMIGLISILYFWRKIDFKDRIFRFLLILSVCSLAYAFFMDPKLGYPRDWDLFAFTGLGYTILGIYIFIQGGKEIKSKDFRYVTLALLLASLVSTIPWIYVNASEKKSAERIEYLLDLDMERSPSGRENLAIYYEQKEEWQKEIDQWQKAIAITGSARYMDNLAAAYFNNQQYDLALKELEMSLKVDSTFHFTHYGLAEIYIQMGRNEEAISEYRKAIKEQPNITQYYDNLGVLLTNLKRYPEAIQVFEEGLASNPEYYPIYRNLGYSYYNVGEYAQAEKNLKIYLERSPQAEDEAEVREVLINIKQKLTKETGE
jgi:tetratricopeptide (TPR) repeat protein